MQRLKTRQELGTQNYLNQSDIKRLLDVSPSTAHRIFKFADEIDSKMRFRVEPRKVRITSVCEVVGISLNTLRKQAGVI